MSASYTTLLESLKRLAQRAGDAILEVYHNAIDIEISQKTDNSPLTLADRNANAVICEGLEKFPLKYPIVSEENMQLPYEQRKNFDCYWLVDPLDGTKEFIQRNGEFTVNIALIQNGAPIMGVVYLPCFDELYWAVKGEGAFRQNGMTVEKITAATFGMEDEGLKVVASRSHLNEETAAFINKLRYPQTVSKGSSLKFLMLAMGEAQLYPRMAPTMEWDTAAAQIILEEAGGKVLQADNGLPLVYNKENMLNPNFIAYAKLR